MRLPRPRIAALALLTVGAAAGRRADAQCINPYLPTSASTRALAMGDANTAGRDDDVIFYGPAQLAIARGTSVAAERYGDGLTSATIASTARIASGGVGLGATMVSGHGAAGCFMRVFPSTGNPFVTLAPRNFSRSLVAAGVAQTYRRFRVGVTGKYITRELGDERTSGVLADVGVARDVSLRDNVPLTIALAAQNLGARAADAMAMQAPLRGALGLLTGAPIGLFDVGLAAQVGVEQNRSRSILKHGRVELGGGGEISYTWLDGYSIALRAGGRTSPALTDAGHLTAGAGIVLDRVAIDYTLEELVGSRFAHRLGVRLR